MADLNLTVDLAKLLQLGRMIRAGIFQTLSAAVERVTIAGAERWREAVMKAPLWEGERRAYAGSITWRMTGPYSGEIVADYKYGQDIETGRPAYDMKRMLDTSMKVRTNAKGRRYLIIPMRHNTPGSGGLAREMPQAVYDRAQELAPSRITGNGWRPSGNGAWDIKTRKPYLVRQRQYAWGDRLEAGLAPKLSKQHKTDPYAGMVRFDTSSGSQRSSAYLTFRVMAEGQSGWVIGARPGLFIAKGVLDALRLDAEKVFAGAVQQDLSAA